MPNDARIDTGPPPYATEDILAQPLPERLRLVCKTFVHQIHGTPTAIYLAYWLKYLFLYVGGWAFFCSFTPGMGNPLSIGTWAFTPIAFQKFVLFAIFYEALGLGCSSGPMTARFKPPIGGILYFARPGTTKIPFFPGIPVFGGTRRTWLDVALYLAHQGFMLRALMAPDITPDMLLPAVILLPLIGITDKVVMLAARYEHYWVALVCLWFACEGEFTTEGDLWISACKVVWVAVWFWAATSKLNHHFPTVVAVMLTNSPLIPAWLREKLYKDYPDDLRPSGLAAAMAHMGTLTEYSFPVVLLLGDGGMLTAAALTVMLGFHLFISLNMPSGMPIEWNITMVFGGFFLFGHNPEVSVLALQALPLLCLFLCFNLVLVPLYGNFFPKHVSFLSSMRYYAGNWAYCVWLFRGDSQKKLSKLVKPAGSMREQLLDLTGDEAAVETAMMMGSGQRLMHLEGRALHDALPAAVDDLDAYEWVEGEILCGIVIGWNFGDGHLHTEQLIDAVQEQCDFDEGELRVVIVESQPLFGKTMAWRVVDAVNGEIARGESKISEMRERQPWPTGERAEAFLRGVRETA